MHRYLLFIGVARQEGAFLFEIILIHDGIEIAVSEAIGVFCNFIRGADIGLWAWWVIFIGEQQVELDLGVVDRVGTDDLVEMVPLTHHVVVVADEGSDWFLEKGLKGLH